MGRWEVMWLFLPCSRQTEHETSLPVKVNISTGYIATCIDNGQTFEEMSSFHNQLTNLSHLSQKYIYSMYISLHTEQ